MKAATPNVELSALNSAAGQMYVVCQQYEYLSSLLYIFLLENDLVKKPIKASLLQILDRDKKITLGRYLEPLWELLQDNKDLLAINGLFNRAVIARNYFTHDYWIEKRILFSDPNLHGKLVAELAFMTVHVNEAVSYLKKTLQEKLKELYGHEVSDYEALIRKKLNKS